MTAEVDPMLSGSSDVALLKSAAWMLSRPAASRMSISETSADQCPSHRLTLAIDGSALVP
jgi:hypothetical protein